MDLKEYQKIYAESSKIHVKHILEHGPLVSFGFPLPQPEQLERIKFIVCNVEGAVLDLGCDSGYILSRCGVGVGLDISRHRIEAAKHWYPNLSGVQALAENIPFSQVFDTVICAELLEHVLNPEKVVEEAFRVLKPNGRFIVTIPDEIHGKSHMNPEHLRKFTEKKIRELFVRRFKIEEFEYVAGDYPAWCFCCIKEVE